MARVPEHFNLAAACLDAHLATPQADRPALILDDRQHGLHELSFAELTDHAARLHALLDRHGIAPQARVLIRLPNCVAYPIAYLGAIRAGRIAVPSSLLLTPDELLFLARDSDAEVLVTDAADWETLRPRLVETALRLVLIREANATSAEGPDIPPGGPGSPTVLPWAESLAAIKPAPEPTRTRAEDPAYLVYTSGTTGFPKGVLHAHRALLGRQPASDHWFDFREGERVLHAGKFNWTYVLGTGLTDPLFRGHTAISAEGYTHPEHWPELIARHRATTFIAVPTIYRQILKHSSATHLDVPSLRHCMSAGEALGEAVLNEWRLRFGQPIYEGLGMSECSYYLSQHPSRPLVPGSPGRIQPGHRIRIVDEALQPVPSGQEGMIAISLEDPGLCLRYWKRPEEDAAARRDGWFLTGDYATEDAQGNVWFHGRRDDLINSFGYRVSPFEIERVMKDHPAIDQCVAVGEELEPGKVLVAICVIPHAGAEVDEEALLAWGREHLARYKAPRRVHVMADYPRTRNGKVLRSALARQLADG